MRRLLMSSVLIGLSACQTAPAAEPALLVEATPEAMTIVAETLASAVDRARIELGPGDLTRDPAISVLPPPLGEHETHSPAMPVMFDLVIQDGDCFLQAREDGALYPLPGVACRAVEASPER
ncbi:MAG: hypothetical protein ACK4MQ_08045 [Hyphomonas sp.]